MQTESPNMSIPSSTKLRPILIKKEHQLSTNGLETSTTTAQAPAPQRRKLGLSFEQKRRICIHQDEHPELKQHDLIKHFTELFDLPYSIPKSTISGLLKNKSFSYSNFKQEVILLLIYIKLILVIDHWTNIERMNVWIAGLDYSGLVASIMSLNLVISCWASSHFSDSISAANFPHNEYSMVFLLFDYKNKISLVKGEYWYSMIGKIF